MKFVCDTLQFKDVYIWNNDLQDGIFSRCPPYKLLSNQEFTKDKNYSKTVVLLVFLISVFTYNSFRSYSSGIGIFILDHTIVPKSGKIGNLRRYTVDNIALSR